ncbi:MAG: TRAP transporter small permease [Desulfovibrionales bacterium]|nr:TRAP transporter small permease [Desulfovibrionales bacterium]
MDAFTKLLARVTSWMRVGGCLCLLAMALVTVADISGRMYHHPIFGSEEVVAFLAVLALGMTLPYAHAHRSHIGVEIFVQLLPSTIRRRLKFFRDILSIGFFVLATIMLAIYGHDKHLSGELSLNLALPEYVLIYVLAGCFAVVTMVMIIDFILFVRNGRQA